MTDSLSDSSSPALKVELLKNGQVVKTVTLPDPRLVYCQEYNRQFSALGYEAKVA